MMTPGLATGSDATKQALKNEMIRTCEARGMSTLTLNSPSKFAVKNYDNLAAIQEGVSLTSSTIAKTDRRYASETSLRSCACLMACIAFNRRWTASQTTTYTIPVNPRPPTMPRMWMRKPSASAFKEPGSLVATRMQSARVSMDLTSVTI